jgi:hypothetical protein
MRYTIPERSFVFEMPDGSEIVGYPLTLAHERAFLRDGTTAIIARPLGRSPEEVYAAGIRYIAAALRKDEEFVERTFTDAQAAQVIKVIITESIPKPEGNGGPEATSP